MFAWPVTATFIDVIALTVIGLFVVGDARRGALNGLLDLAGAALALLTALVMYGTVSGWLVAQTGLGYSLAKPAAFATIWIAADLLIATALERYYAGSARAVAASRAGRVLGTLTGAVLGVFVVAPLLALTAALPLSDVIGKAVRDSRAGAALGESGEVLERGITTFVGDAVHESLTLLTVPTLATDRVALRFRVDAPRVDDAVEIRMLELLNAERSRADLPELREDPAIRQVARAYSIEMLKGGFFSHVEPDGRSAFDRLDQAGIPFQAAAENLALAANVDAAHDGLMTSPDHRANILNGRYRRVGIGVADGGSHGKAFTQNFAD